MPTKNSPFLDYLMKEVFADLPGISSRPMFGGYGLYKKGVFFAIIAYDTLYFKVDETTREAYEERGSQPFVYDGKGKPVQMSYWEVPDSILEDSSMLKKWINDACNAYLRSKRK